MISATVLFIVIIYQAVLSFFLIAAKPSFILLVLHTSKSLDIILSNSSEDEKITNLRRSFKPLFLHFIIIICFFSVFLFVIVAPVVAYENEWLSQNIYSLDYYIEWTFTSAFLIILYFLFKKKNDYNEWSKLLHKVVLDNYYISRFLLKTQAKRANTKKYLLVTGLARSGTTAVLNQINESGFFKSLVYSDMPFVLCPGLKISNILHTKKKERAHGDGLFINSSSPEALEEYFFKNILNDQYIQKDKLKLHEIPKDVLKLYKEYQGLVIKGSGKHYLAKNNNLILRLDSLLKLDSDLRVLLMFRDPVQHAISLFNQHQSFLSKQKEDPFVQTYMDWLAHHEFGLNHKKMFFDQSEEQSKYTPNQVNYWLENWINYYTYVLNFGGSKQVCFVSFEDYCVFPKQVLSKTVHVLGFDNVGGLSATKPYTPIVVNMVVDKSLKEKAYDLYEKMNEISGFNRKTD